MYNIYKSNCTKKTKNSVGAGCITPKGLEIENGKTFSILAVYSKKKKLWASCIKHSANKTWHSCP